MSEDREDAESQAKIQCYLVENGPFDKRELLLETYDHIDSLEKEAEKQKAVKKEKEERKQLEFLTKKYK